MNAISESGKVYVHILELHKNITDENIRDSVPDLKIATIAGSENINWEWIMSAGLFPVVKASPSILRSTLKDYIFTPEFWMCECEFDWLRLKHFECPECKSTVINYLTRKPLSIKTTEHLWGKGPFDSIETTSVRAMVNVAKRQGGKLSEENATVYKHLKYFNFNWVDAFAIENF